LEIRYWKRKSGSPRFEVTAYHAFEWIESFWSDEQNTSITVWSCDRFEFCVLFIQNTIYDNRESRFKTKLAIIMDKRRLNPPIFLTFLTSRRPIIISLLSDGKKEYSRRLTCSLSEERKVWGKNHTKMKSFLPKRSPNVRPNVRQTSEVFNIKRYWDLDLGVSILLES
jgi:hypothetical protein